MGNQDKHNKPKKNRSRFITVIVIVSIIVVVNVLAYIKTTHPYQEYQAYIEQHPILKKITGSSWILRLLK